jgi:hypothetical protein
MPQFDHVQVPNRSKVLSYVLYKTYTTKMRSIACQPGLEVMPGLHCQPLGAPQLEASRVRKLAPGNEHARHPSLGF